MAVNLVLRKSSKAHPQSFEIGDTARIPDSLVVGGTALAGTEKFRVGGDIQVDGSVRGPDTGSGVVIGHTGASSNTGSTLQLRGFSTTQRDNLNTVAGMVVYNSTLNEIQLRNNGRWASTVSYVTATTNPTINDDVNDGYTTGTIWINTTTQSVYLLSNSTAGAAVWSIPQVVTGKTICVDSENGNDTTGIRGRLDKAFLTIQAAIAVAQAGDTILVLPGSYSVNGSQITIPTDVSLVGLDRRRCRITYTGSTTITAITVGVRSHLSNIDLVLQPTSGTTTGVSIADLSGVANDVSINPSSSGNVVGFNVSFSGATTSGKANLRLCSLIGVGAGNPALRVDNASCVPHFHESFFDGPIGVEVLSGSPTFSGCRIGGTIGLKTSVGSTTTLDGSTVVTTFDNQGSLNTDAFSFPRDNFTAVVDPSATDDITKGYAAGSRWINATSDALFTCADGASGNALWAFVQTGAGAGIGSDAPGEHFLGTLLDYGAAGGTGVADVQYTRVYFTAGTVIPTMRCYIDTGSSAARSVRMGLYDNVITGTISVTNNSATITGTGTAFTTDLKVGQGIQFGNQLATIYVIDTISSNTNLTLTSVFTGSTNASTTLTSAASSRGIPGNRTAQTNSSVTTGFDGSFVSLSLTSPYTIPVAGYYWTAHITDSSSLKFSVSPGVYRTGFLPVRHQTSTTTVLPATASALSNPSSSIIYCAAIDNSG